MKLKDFSDLLLNNIIVLRINRYIEIINLIQNTVNKRGKLAILILSLLLFNQLLQIQISASTKEFNNHNEETPIFSNQFNFSDFYDFKEQFNMAAPENKQTVLNQYMTFQSDLGFPAIINNTKVVFIYYPSSPVTSANVAGDFNGWNPNNSPMSRLDPLLNFFYYENEFEPTARLDYKIVSNGNWIVDPLNPNTISGGFGPNSELAMPLFIQPVEIIYRNDISHGRLTEITTSFDGPNPSLTVYTPSNYGTLNNLTTVYFTDGSEYINLGSAVIILDNLIADGLIDPVIAIFIDPYPSTSQRHTWYDCSKNDYTNYLQLLVNYIDNNYKTNIDSYGRIHIGDSLGGQITAFTGLQLSNLFKNLGVHSGAFWDGNSAIGPIGCQIKDQISEADASLDLRFFFTAGKYEETIWNDTITVQNSIREKGWGCGSMYLFEGHSWGQWRHTLNDMLGYFIGKETDFNSCPDPFANDETITNQTSTSNISNSISTTITRSVIDTTLITSQSTTETSQSSTDSTSSDTYSVSSIFTLFSVSLIIIIRISKREKMEQYL